MQLETLLVKFFTHTLREFHFADPISLSLILHPQILHEKRNR